MFGCQGLLFQIFAGACTGIVLWAALACFCDWLEERVNRRRDARE